MLNIIFNNLNTNYLKSLGLILKDIRFKGFEMFKGIFNFSFQFI